MTQKLWECAAGFFGAMVAKLIHKHETRGYTEWDQKSSRYLLEKLNANVDRRDWVDVANLAMMLHYHDQKIKAVKS